MYEKHFGLTERPFSIAPDPRFLYMSPQHREALAHLLYGIGEGGGFVQLTGEVGTGKTTICRCLLEQIPGHVDLALILNPRVTALELVASLCDELGIRYARETTSIKQLTDVLNAYLLDAHARGRRTVLMIDEAQNLSADALEQVRLLTNLETTREKLLQIILVGQPELRTLLARPELRQLSQRITARYHLEPIHRAETAAYIRHRLQVCGEDGLIFSDSAIDLIQKLSLGVPRLINVLCDRAMLGAFVEGKRKVDPAIVIRSAREVLPEEGLDAPSSGAWRWVAATATAVVLLVAAGGFLLPVDRWLPGVSGQAMKAGSAMASAPLVEPEPPVVEPVSIREKVTAPVQEVVKAGVEPADYPASSLLLRLAAAGPESVDKAWAGLYRLWSVQSGGANDEQACLRASEVGLRCLQGGGSLAMLRHYNRPAVLLLIGPEGRRVPVLLEEVNGEQASIQVDGRPLVIGLDELENYWFGEYRLLWKTPPSGRSALHPGDRSTDVQWLRDQMQTVTGLTSIAPDPAFFDDGLRQLVQSFQRQQGLDADGVAGVRTLINLNSRAGRPSIPRLVSRASTVNAGLE